MRRPGGAWRAQRARRFRQVSVQARPDVRRCSDRHEFRLPWLYEAVTQGLGIGCMFEQAVTRSDGPVRLPIIEMPKIYMEHVTCLSRNMRRREMAALIRLADQIAVV